MKLRPYQEVAVGKASSVLEGGQRCLLVSPTGSGKSVMGAATIERMRSANRVLWTAHSVELLRQAKKELISAGIPKSQVGVLSGVERENHDARVLVASVNMLRMGVPQDVGLVVLDEAHRACAKSYRAILEATHDARVLGLTATPERLDGQPLGDVFDEMVVAADALLLQADGYLAKPLMYGVPIEKARAMVSGIRTRYGDFSQRALGAAMMRGSLVGDVVAECARLAPGRQTLVFATNREHGRALASRFAESGRSTGYLDGETPAREREALVERLRDGALEVVVNVDVLSEGFDCPPVSCVALARPTKSLTRYLQQVGRALRPFGKKRPIVLDHAGNVWRFGLPDASREWSLDARAPTGSGKAPVRRCDVCGAMCLAGLRVCPECGAEWPLTERERAERDAELERIRESDAEVAAARLSLKSLAYARGYTDKWVNGVMRDLYGGGL